MIEQKATGDFLIPAFATDRISDRKLLSRIIHRPGNCPRSVESQPDAPAKGNDSPSFAGASGFHRAVNHPGEQCAHADGIGGSTANRSHPRPCEVSTGAAWKSRRCGSTAIRRSPHFPERGCSYRVPNTGERGDGDFGEPLSVRPSRPRLARVSMSGRSTIERPTTNVSEELASRPPGGSSVAEFVGRVLNEAWHLATIPPAMGD